MDVVTDLDGFRGGLLRHLKIDQDTWTLYWREMSNYRNTHVAHLDFKKPGVENYPKLDLALESADFYYEYVLSELRKQGVANYPDDIRDYSARFREQAEMIAKKAVVATADIREAVY